MIIFASMRKLLRVFFIDQSLLEQFSVSDDVKAFESALCEEHKRKLDEWTKALAAGSYKVDGEFDIETAEADEKEAIKYWKQLNLRK